MTFPALTALEVRDTHIEGSTIIVEMTPRLVDEYDERIEQAKTPRPLASPPQKSSLCAVM